MSPTYERTRRVQRDLQRLTRTQRDDFKAARRLFVEGLREGHFHPSLRVKRVQSARGVWEMSWAPDGRATFEYGAELHPGEPHVIWRRVGTHRVLDDP